MPVKESSINTLPSLWEVPITPGEDPRQMSPLNLAFVGDAVHSLYVRTRLGCLSSAPSGRLHARAVAHVSAPGQARALAAVAPLLDDEEAAILRRGRNAHTPAVPRSCTPEQYHSATALEGLIGYLYLSRRAGRLEQVLKTAFDAIEGQAPRGEEDAGS